MAISRPFLISLIAATGMCLEGCLPAPVSPPLSTFPPPGGPTSPPPLGRYPSGGLPTLSINPWKPSVPERDWTSIVIHHTASEAGSVESIHEAHLRRKDKDGNPWLGIAYHFVIGNGQGMADGEIEPTFRWRQQLHGAHAGDQQHNQHGIGIALVGNFDHNPPTAKQLASVKRLVATLKTAYAISSSQVIGHSDIRATACPGKYFPMAEVSLGNPDVQLSENDRSERQSDETPSGLVASQRNTEP